MKKVSWIAAVICAVAGATCVRPVMAWDPLLRAPHPLLGKALPEFEIKDTELTTWSFADIRKGRRAVLFFWATWCPHCRSQLQDIQANWTKIEEAGVVMMLINVGENRKQAIAYLQRAGLPQTGYLDWDSAVSNKFGVYGLPTYIFVNEEGIVTAVQHQLPENIDSVY